MMHDPFGAHYGAKADRHAAGWTTIAICYAIAAALVILGAVLRVVEGL
jgi:hypothetical protein